MRERSPTERRRPPFRRRRIATLCLAAALISAAPQANAQGAGVDAQCRLATGGVLSRALFVDDTVTTAFATRPGGCAYGLGNVGGRPFQAERLEIVQRPRHGRIGVQGRVSFAYVPRSGFAGNDVFQIRYTGIRDGQRRTTVVTFEVSVER